MKPRSLIGPLFLIFIGVMFLVNNLRPEMRYFDALARYWPYLLIVWGGLRLLEVLVWFVRGRLTPGYRMGAGEWTLVIFVCLVGSGMFLFSRHFPREGRPFFWRGVEMFGESFDFPIAEQKLAGPQKPFRLVIDNRRGNARIIGAASGEIRVSGRKTVRAMTRTDAEEADKATPLELRQQGDTVVVRTNQEKVTGDRRVSVDLEITLPKAVSVEARGRYGDFDIDGIDGDVDIASDNAGVRLQNIGGNVRVETRRSDIVRASGVRGAVELKGKGQDLELDTIGGQVTITAAYFGDIELKNLAKSLRMDADRGGSTQLEAARLPGEIRMDLRSLTATDLVGPIRLNAKSLDVQIGSYTQALDVSVERGDVDLRPVKIPLGRADIRTRSGNIDFAAPPGAAFRLKATTLRGEIENQYGAPLKLESVETGSSGGNKHSAVLSGAVGQGPEIVLTTNRGTIIVRKGVPPAAGIPEPPRPPKPVPPGDPLSVEKQ